MERLAVRCERDPAYSATTQRSRQLALELPEIALVLVRFDHVTRFIVNPNHSVM
jgi:hypothetical protein